jgi:AcrR family transcriptional regulator
MNCMPPDATDTKRRLLAAAFAEFAEHGLAGARIDRIAERSGANKRLIYLHFGNKEQLFDLIAGQAIETLTREVPFTAEDLPGYAAAMFDYLAARPELIRLEIWSLLERPAATMIEARAYQEKVAAVQAAQQSGAIGAGLSPAGLLSLVLGLITSWFAAPPALTSQVTAEPAAPQQLAVRRAEVVAAVQAISRPAS